MNSSCEQYLNILILKISLYFILGSKNPIAIYKFSEDRKFRTRAFSLFYIISKNYKKQIYFFLKWILYYINNS